MPGFHAMTGHDKATADRSTDQAPIDQFTAGLNAGTHEGVGCTADCEAEFLGKAYQFFTFFQIGAQGLFRINMLAGQQSSLGNFKMLIGTGQVKYDIDLRISKQFMHCIVDFGNAVFSLGFFSTFTNQVTDSN